MPKLDMTKTTEIFERLNAVVVGEPLFEALVAAQDLYCALVCLAARSKGEALSAARSAAVDIQATIDKNFDWYNSDAAHRDATPPADPTRKH